VNVKFGMTRVEAHILKGSAKTTKMEDYFK
jgi:hypothetical protein